MGYIRIENKGEIDINALTLLGASSKAGDSSKIGFFGSGNKYALATFMRNDVGVRIFSGDTEFVIETEPVSFRGQDFNRIVINGVHTSITTRTGPEWEMWMAVREFLCNAIDEGDALWGYVDDIEPARPGYTAVHLEGTPDVMRIFDNIEDISILEVDPIVTVKTSYGDVSIYDRQTGKVYRKGICCSAQWSKSLYAYSFDSVDINESRVVQSNYLIFERIASALAACTDPDIVGNILAHVRAGEDALYGYVEDSVLFEGYWEGNYCRDKLSFAWRDAIRADGRVICSETYSTIIPPEDRTTYYVLPDTFYDRVIKDWPEIPHAGDRNTMYVEAEPSDDVVQAVTAAYAELRGLALDGGGDYTLKYVRFVSNQTIMQVDHDLKELRVSVEFSQDLDYTAILLEEFTHVSTGYSDGSRSLQTLLFKRWLDAERRSAKAIKFRELVESAVSLTK